MGLEVVLAIIGIVLIFSSNIRFIPFAYSEVYRYDYHSSDLFNDTIAFSSALVNIGHKYVEVNLTSEHHTEYEFTVTGGDIDFYIMDESSFINWVSTQDVNAFRSSQNATGASGSFIVPHSGKWYFIFIDEPESKKTILLYISEHWYTPVYREVLGYRSVLPQVFSLVGALIPLIIGISVVVAEKLRKA